MKESYVERLAAHDGPETCVAARKGRGEALTGVRAGRVFSRETNELRSADAVRVSGRQHPSRRYRKSHRGSARSETPCMYGNTSRENREILGPPADDGLRVASGSRKTHADDERTREVGQVRSTCEVSKQDRATGCGGDGGKGSGQRKSVTATQVPDTAPGNGDEHGRP